MERGQLRIGELSRRVGVTPELLRAWERRYGLLEPERTSGGFRLYSEEDVATIRRMRALVDDGLAAAEAARLVNESPEAPPETRPTSPQPELVTRAAELRALEAFDGASAHWALDRAFSAFQVETVLQELLLPYLRDLGERWERGEVTVGQEHFASNLIRARLLGLGAGWSRGHGPRALLACPEGELHDLPLVMFGLALWRRRWRITFLGADTPIDALLATARSLAPDAIVLSAADPQWFEAIEDKLELLADGWSVALAGHGATPDLATRTRAWLLDTDPITAAEKVAERPQSRNPSPT